MEISKKQFEYFHENFEELKFFYIISEKIR